MPLTINELIKQLEEKANDHLRFSKGLWESGDHPNAHYQEGLGNGILSVVRTLKENQEEHYKVIQQSRNIN